MTPLASAAFVVIAAAQASIGATGHEQAFAATTADARPVPKSVWRVDAAGNAVHEHSTLICPARTENGDVGRPAVHDVLGFDVSCRFDLPGARLAVFLTRRTGQPLNDDLIAARGALMAQQPSRAIDTPEPVMDGARSELYAQAPGGTVTLLSVADLSGWTVKIRATFGGDAGRDVIDRAEALLTRARATAGTHLAACASAPPVQRPGSLIADREIGTRLSLIAGMSEQAGTENVTPPKRAERWCAEVAMQEANTPLVFWRNVATGGADGVVDRVTLMTVEEPPTWLISANGAANMLVDKEPAPLIHQLTEPRGDAVFFFAFYRGRPSVSTIAPLIRGIIVGAARPLARYNVKTNTVTIPKSAAKNQQ
jgi:hypothetical protein